MIFEFLLLQFTISSNSEELIISSDACTCNKSSGFCDAPCKQESNKEDVIVKCTRPFNEPTLLHEWLLQEIFCHFKDRREKKKNTIDSHEVIDKISINTNDISPPQKNIIKKNEFETIYIPSPFLASSECHLDVHPIELFATIDSMRCYYNYSDISDITNLLNASRMKKDFIIKKCPYKSLDYFVTYEYNGTHAHAIDMDIIQTCHEEPNSTDPNFENLTYPLQVEVHFFNQTYNQELHKKKMKSGEAGYSHGQPLIAIRWEETDEPEPFPVPFGVDCSSNESMAYTPLQFGYDTIGGCSKNGAEKSHILEVLKRYTHVSLMGQAQGNFEKDWLQIDSMEEIDNCSNLVLNVNYEYVGNVHNPQSRIYSASYKCNSKDSNYFLFMANFLRTSDESLKSFIPKPKGLPDDTFAPII